MQTLVEANLLHKNKKKNCSFSLELSQEQKL